MLIAEELLLLSFDDETGRPTVSGQTSDPALGGALLAELGLMERIGITPDSDGLNKRRRVTVTSAKPTDDVELDLALEAIVAHEGRPVKDLVSVTSSRRLTKGLRDRLLQRLTDRGVLTAEHDTVLGVIPRRSWPTCDPGPEREVRARLHSALVDGTTPTERTVVLISLLLATKQLTKVIETTDKPLARRRAKALSEGDWAGRAVRQAIEELYAAVI